MVTRDLYYTRPVEKRKIEIYLIAARFRAATLRCLGTTVVRIINFLRNSHNSSRDDACVIYNLQVSYGHHKLNTTRTLIVMINLLDAIKILCDEAWNIMHESRDDNKKKIVA